MEQQKTRKNADGDEKEEMSSLEKVSPHFKRIANALKEVDALKSTDKAKPPEPPSILLGDELTKFEGLL